MVYLLPILAVVLGFIFVYFLKPSNQKLIKILLSFSGGFLLATTIFHLIPEVFTETDHHLHGNHEHGHFHNKEIGIFILVGILFQIFLEYFSKGAEHGHVHSHTKSSKFPWLLFISLFLHAFLEGFPVHKTHGMLIGILVHKVPVAIILGTFLINSKIKKVNVYIFMLLFACATPLGTLIADEFQMITKYYKQVSAVVIGIFLHISTTILFESSEGHKYNITKLAAIIIAISIAYFV